MSTPSRRRTDEDAEVIVVGAGVAGIYQIKRFVSAP